MEKNYEEMTPEEKKQHLLQRLREQMKFWDDIIGKIERGEIPEETVKRLEYIAGKSLSLTDIVKKVSSGKELTSSECDLYLEILKEDWLESKLLNDYTKPPDVL